MAIEGYGRGNGMSVRYGQCMYVYARASRSLPCWFGWHKHCRGVGAMALSSILYNMKHGHCKYVLRQPQLRQVASPYIIHKHHRKRNLNINKPQPSGRAAFVCLYLLFLARDAIA